MMKLSDYLVKRLVEYGAQHVFMLTGGGAMHLNDSLGHEKSIRVICNHHEQASAMAAEGYARLTGKMGVINVTTGPGGINALNGVFGAWTDSIPMLVLSGQVKRETCVGFNEVTVLRQLDDQEGDIIPMARGITKYAVTLREPEKGPLSSGESDRSGHFGTAGTGMGGHSPGYPGKSHRRGNSCPPEDTLDAARAIAGASAAIMPGLGHFPMSENPEAVRKHLLPVLERIRKGG